MRWKDFFLSAYGIWQGLLSLASIVRPHNLTQEGLQFCRSEVNLVPQLHLWMAQQQLQEWCKLVVANIHVQGLMR